MKRWIVVLLVLCVGGCSYARADEASKRAKAEELFATLHMDRIMDQVMDSVMKQVLQMTQTMPGVDLMNADQRALVADFQKRVVALIEQNMGWKALEPEFITLYATTYTEEELDGIVTFYKSPVGQSMIAKTPELLQKSSAISRQHMAELQPQINKMMQDFMKQVAAKTSSPAGASSAPSTSSTPPASGAKNP